MFEEPKIEIMKSEAEDVITLSGSPLNPNPNPNDGEMDWDN